MTSRPKPNKPATERDDVPWKARVEEPINRFVHYPVARWLVRGLVRTPITADQVTLVQPLLAALAGYLIALGGPLLWVAAVVIFEVRSLLDCVDGELARAKGTASASGHALDAAADLLSATFLHVGIYWYLREHPPPAGAWSGYLSMGMVVILAAVNGALRGFAAGHFLQKLGAIFDKGRDETVEDVRDKLLALRTDHSVMAKWVAWIAWWGHLAFEQERFDAERSRPLNTAEVTALQQAKHEPLTRFMAALWSVSNGDFWITLTLASLLFGVLWPMLLMFATLGYVWIVGMVALSGWFVRRTAARARRVTT